MDWLIKLPSQIYLYSTFHIHCFKAENHDVNVYNIFISSSLSVAVGTLELGDNMVTFCDDIYTCVYVCVCMELFDHYDLLIDEANQVESHNLLSRSCCDKLDEDKDGVVTW